MDNYKIFLFIIVFILSINLISLIYKKPCIIDRFKKLNMITFDEYLKENGKKRIIQQNIKDFYKENKKNWEWIKDIKNETLEKLYNFSQNNNISFMCEKSIKFNRIELEDFVNRGNIYKGKEERVGVYLSTIFLSQEKIQELYSYSSSSCINFLKDLGKKYTVIGIMYGIDISENVNKEKWYIDYITNKKELVDNSIEIKDKKNKKYSYINGKSVLYRFYFEEKKEKFINDSSYIPVMEDDFKINNNYKIYFLGRNFVEDTYSIYYRL